VTTLETVEAAEKFPIISRAAFLGIAFQEASFLAPIAQSAGLDNILYGWRLRLLDNLRHLGIPAETAQKVRNLLDSRSFEDAPTAQVAIREDLAYSLGIRVAEGFQAGFMLAGLTDMLDLFLAQSREEDLPLDEDRCRMIIAYIEGIADHVEHSSPDLFPGLIDHARHVWKPSVAAPLAFEDARRLMVSAREYMLRFTTPWGITEFRDPAN
jgi:hypothetical protein